MITAGLYCMSVSETEPYCINHTGTATRVRCSSCDSPICVKCMKQSSVGMKCPECARLPKHARAAGSLPNYLAAAGACLAVAGLARSIVNAIGGSVFGFILPILIGYLCGSAALIAARHHRDRVIQASAAIGTFIGFVCAPFVFGATLATAFGPSALISATIASAFAGLRAGS